MKELLDDRQVVQADDHCCHTCSHCSNHHCGSFGEEGMFREGVSKEGVSRELDDDEYEAFLKCVQARSLVARNNIDVALGDL